MTKVLIAIMCSPLAMAILTVAAEAGRSGG
jgi:hypothetical protein